MNESHKVQVTLHVLRALLSLSGLDSYFNLAMLDAQGVSYCCASIVSVCVLQREEAKNSGHQK